MRASGSSARKASNEVGDPVPEQVVAEVHDEGRLPEEGLGGEHGVGEPERSLLLDVGDRDAEPLAVARRGADFLARLRRDDDAHVADPGIRHRLDAVEEDGLLGHGHELLGARVGERAQAGSLAPRKDEALELPHRGGGG